MFNGLTLSYIASILPRGIVPSGLGLQYCEDTKALCSKIQHLSNYYLSLSMIFWCLGWAFSKKVKKERKTQKKKFWFDIRMSHLLIFFRSLNSQCDLYSVKQGHWHLKKYYKKYTLHVPQTETHNCLMKRLYSVLNPSLTEIFFLLPSEQILLHFKRRKASWWLKKSVGTLLFDHELRVLCSRFLR